MYTRMLTQPASWEGTGVHSGTVQRVRLEPIPVSEWTHLLETMGSFWILRRRTGKTSRVWPVSLRHLIDTHHATTLGVADDAVTTVEHLLATFMGLRIGGVWIDVDGDEIPILDGSARPFVERLLPILQDTDFPWPRHTLHTPVRVQHETAWLRATPSDRWRVEYTIVFDHPMIGTQSWTGVMETIDFVHEIAPARTFGFMRDAPHLFKRGRAYGASPENTLILTDHGLLNPPLRFPDEFVRHKILDLMGDLALLGGGWPRVHIRVYRGGHRLHIAFVRHMLAQLL